MYKIDWIFLYEKILIVKYLKLTINLSILLYFHFHPADLFHSLEQIEVLSLLTNSD